MIPGERPEILEIGDWDEVVESRPMTVEDGSLAWAWNDVETMDAGE